MKLYGAEVLCTVVVSYRNFVVVLSCMMQRFDGMKVRCELYGAKVICAEVVWYRSYVMQRLVIWCKGR